MSPRGTPRCPYCGASLGDPRDWGGEEIEAGVDYQIDCPSCEAVCLVVLAVDGRVAVIQ
jgi:hypothetical protein